jgi:spermidine/putrescine transport system substrate-binding protein
MDVLDQLGAVRAGKLSRRAFNRSLLAAGVAMTAMPLMPRRVLAAPSDHATYFTWGGFDIPELFVPYVEKHGELPNFSIYGSTEDALTKLRSGFVAEVAHPCSSDIPNWVSTGLFQPIDTSRLSNWPDVFPELYDMAYNQKDGKVWMAPFEWGQSSIIYRTDLFDLQGEESWDMMWDKRYSGRLGSLATASDAWWVGAIKAGVPFEEIGTDAAFDKIAAVLREQRPLIRVYTDDTTSTDNAMAAGELVAVLGWNSSALALQTQGIPVKFAQPKEGALTWVCGPMLHAQAPNLDSAYDIIDSLLSVPSGEFLINDYGYGAVNRKAFEKFDDAKLASMGLSRDPNKILKAGHFGIPQSLEWQARTVNEFEEIKSGF